jgi:transcriptional regulator with XRE-family HTH domain
MPKNTHEQLKKAALSRSGVKKEYDALSQEFSLLEAMLKARLKAGKTQNDVARVMKTTTSVVGRLETGGGKQKHSPTIESLRRYAKAVDCDLEVKFVHSKNKTKNITKRDNRKNGLLECK